LDIYIQKCFSILNASVPSEDFEDYIEQEEVEIDDEDYPGVLVDKSLLINYEDHVVK